MNHDSFPAAARTAGRRARVKLQRRADFIGAAAQVFGEKGYHDASIEEIARVAESGAGTIYLYFKNKESLYVALLEEKMRELTAFVKRRVGDGTATWDALRAAVAAQFEFYELNRAFFESFVRERLEMKARLKQADWERVNSAYEQFIRFLADLIHAGQRRRIVRRGDSRQLAVALCGMVNQLTRDWFKQQPEDSLAERTALVAGLFRDGACLAPRRAA